MEVVEHVTEVTEKLAADAASSMPENGSLHKVAVEVECVAKAVDNDAHKVEAVNDKVCYALSMLLPEIEYFNIYVMDMPSQLDIDILLCALIE